MPCLAHSHSLCGYFRKLVPNPVTPVFPANSVEFSIPPRTRAQPAMKIPPVVPFGIALISAPLAMSQTPVQQAYLKTFPEAKGIPGARFGYSVGVDRNLAVVGMPYEYGAGIGVNGIHPTSAAFSGAASVFYRRGTFWYQGAFLKASNTGTYDFPGLVEAGELVFEDPGAQHRMKHRPQEITVHRHSIGVCWHVQVGHGGRLKRVTAQPATAFPRESPNPPELTEN
jgi:hypothetical protein